MHIVDLMKALHHNCVRIIITIRRRRITGISNTECVEMCSNSTCEMYPNRPSQLTDTDLKSWDSEGCYLLWMRPGFLALCPHPPPHPLRFELHPATLQGKVRKGSALWKYPPTQRMWQPAESQSQSSWFQQKQKHKSRIVNKRCLLLHYVKEL